MEQNEVAANTASIPEVAIEESNKEVEYRCVCGCLLHHCASIPWFCNHSQWHCFFLVIVSFFKETCKSNVSTTTVKDSVLAKRHSDFESSSSVDCRDSDCSDSSACDSDTKYYQRTFTVVDPTNAGAHDRHHDSWNPKSVATAEGYANAIQSNNGVFGSATQTDVIL